MRTSLAGSVGGPGSAGPTALGDKIMPLNPSEELVDRLCRRSFLSLWSFANPRGRNDKELCDVLVVCDPDVIIFSVKDITITGDEPKDTERWRRKAIEKSCAQIYGAERWIRDAREVVRADGTTAIPFPDPGDVRVHRIAVALGSDGKASLAHGDFGKGFVHVLDEISLQVVMRELDTIADFVEYLADKEDFLGRCQVILSGEEDLLGHYIHAGRRFPDAADLMMVNDDIWTTVSAKAEFLARKREDEVSYIWDRIISLVSADIQSGRLEVGGPIDQTEQVMRVMARENRFSRRMLGDAFKGFLEQASESGSAARRLVAMSGVGYVFLARAHGTDREERRQELMARCGVARNMQETPTVVGIATESPAPGSGSSFDLLLFDFPEWSDEQRTWAEGIQRDLGYWNEVRETRAEVDEFPAE